MSFRPHPLLGAAASVVVVVGLAACPAGDCEELLTCNPYDGAASGGGGAGGAGGAGPEPGSVLFENAFTATDAARPTAVALLGDGSFVVVGDFGGSLDFGGAALSAADTDAFAARFAPDGTEIWSDRYGGAGVQSAVDVAIDSDDDIVMLGVYANSIAFGALTPLSAADEQDVFVTTLSAAGGALHASSVGSPDGDAANYVAVAAGDAVVVSGGFADSITIGSETLTETAGNAIANGYLASLAENDYATAWAKGVLGGLSDRIFVRGLGTDGASAVALVLSTTFAGDAEITYDNTHLSPPGTAFVPGLIRTAATGGLDRFVSLGALAPTDVSIYPNGDILVCGHYLGVTDGGTFTLPSSEDEDVWAAAFTAGGAVLWGRRFGGAGVDGADEQVRCEALADGTFVLAASSDGDFDIGATVVPGTGVKSVVLARVRADGTAVWARRTTGSATALRLAARDDALVVAAEFTGVLGIEQTFAGGHVYLARLAL